MKKNTKSIVITSLIITLLLIIGLIYCYTTSVEYSFYKILNPVDVNDFMPENISTKCKFTTHTEIPTSDKPMFQYLLGVKELKEEISCKQYLYDDESMTSYFLQALALGSKNNNFKKRLLLYKFMLNKKIIFRLDEGDFGYGYKCRDNDTDEKVCTLIDLFEQKENLYFKKVNSKWLLIHIDIDIPQ